MRSFGWHFLTRLKANRQIRVGGGKLQAVSEAGLCGGDGTVVWLKGFGEIKVFRIFATNGAAEYWATDWRDLTEVERETQAKAAWRIEMYHRALKQQCRRLVNARILRDNPALSVQQLAGNDLSFHVITEKEEKAYLLACPQPLQDVAALMLETGMRPIEIFRLRREDVALERNSLQITRSKTMASIRRIHLSDKAKAILKTRIERFDGDFLFPQNDKDGAAPIRILDVFHRKAIGDLGLKFRLYDCRHTFATRALESGIDLLTLASLLGHANLKMVMRYAHPSEERKAEAIRQMQKNKTGAKAV